MRSPRILRGLGTVVLVVVVLPTLSVALPISVFAASGTAVGGCHGHSEPMPAPSHTCCYAQPQAPAPHQVVPSPFAPDQIIGVMTVAEPLRLVLVIATPLHVDTSPPLPSVLRI